MTQHSSNPARETDAHALPDLEVFYARRGDLQLEDYAQFDFIL